MGSLPKFTIVLRGYDMAQVDHYVMAVMTAPAGATVPVPAWTIRMRGYERTQVDAFVRSVAAGHGSPPPGTWGAKFAIVKAGYDPEQVDAYVAAASRRIAELEQALAERDDA